MKNDRQYKEKNDRQHKDKNRRTNPGDQILTNRDLEILLRDLEAHRLAVMLARLIFEALEKAVEKIKKSGGG